MEKNNSTKIDQYLDNQLSAQEKSAFETAMDQDATLKKEVKFHQLERRAARELLKNSFRDKIKKNRANASISWETLAEEEVIEKKEEAKIVQMRPMRRLLSIAATLLILIMAGTTWWSNNQFSNESLLADGYYQAASGGDKSGEAMVNPIFQGGLQAYFVDKDYAQAIQQFTAIPQTDANYLDAQYYLGHSQLQQKQYDSAIASFENVLQAPTLSAFISKEEVAWNQLLAYLGNEDTGVIFQQKLTRLIESGKPPFQQKAKDLQQQLNSFWRQLVLF